jgi:hypothetical protein
VGKNLRQDDNLIISDLFSDEDGENLERLFEKAPVNAAVFEHVRQLEFSPGNP